jgi:hypothetical protein
MNLGVCVRAWRTHDGNVWEQKRQQGTVAQLGNCDAEFELRNHQSASSSKWYRNLAAVVQTRISMQNGHTKGDRPGGGGS